MLRRVAKLKAADEFTGFCRRKRFLERAACVSVQIVTHKNHFRRVTVSCCEQPLHLKRPVDFGSLLPNTHRLL